jgi:predicted nucleotidyltransferase
MYLREISAKAKVAPGQAQRELEHLVRLRLVIRSEEGRQVFYRPNPDAPIYEELKSIVFKTFGISETVRTALEPFLRKIAWAFIYGSIASDKAVASSDIDLMVVSDSLGPSDLLEALYEAGDRLRRKISLQTYGKREFVGLARAGNHFIDAVLSRPRIVIHGDEKALDALAARKSS